MTIEILGIIAVVAPFMTAIALVWFTLYLHHKRKVLQLNTGQTSRELEEVRARLECFEKRCEKLEEQLVAVEMQLADEQRALDKKLASMLDKQGPQTSDNVSDSTRRGERREPLRG